MSVDGYFPTEHIPKMDQDLFEFLYLMYHLQDTADLTYKEARCILMERSGDNIESLAKEFGCTKNAIHRFKMKGERKILYSVPTPDENC